MKIRALAIQRYGRYFLAAHYLRTELLKRNSGRAVAGEKKAQP
jgi:hypothetical protein